jgi:hypothetical protein
MLENMKEGFGKLWSTYLSRIKGKEERSPSFEIRVNVTFVFILLDLLWSFPLVLASQVITFYFENSFSSRTLRILLSPSLYF